ncbi:MAG: class I SAM-dependent methyltransferase [Candidatus Margulisbacteria bacterium]|nr:class I SAM-dependent methyltransferase [Candidatus Margulisiibacteriota bacterium]
MPELLNELNKLSADDLAKLVTAIMPKCLPGQVAWRDYIYRYFPLWEKHGFHITPNHFYSPVPEVYKLRQELWEKAAEMPGLDFRAGAQLKLLDEFHKKYRQEYDEIPVEKPSDPDKYYLLNGLFEGLDGYLLYCMLRHFKPKNIIEIGSGYSTILAAQAGRKNEQETGRSSEMTVIDPFPNEVVKRGLPNTKLVAQKVEEVDGKIFDKLGAGDFLFIDSSHVLKVDGDVKFEYTSLLPRLKSGVIIHIHDIFFPAEYPKEFFYGLMFFFNEQYLVQAILANGGSYEIMLAGQYLYQNHLNKIKEFFPKYYRGEPWPVGDRPWQSTPASLWLKKR